MPCYDGRGRETIREIKIEVDKPQTIEKLNLLEDRLNKATQYLCYMLGEYKLGGDFMINLPEPIQEWSREHTEADTIRVKAAIDMLIAQGKTSAFIIAQDLCNSAIKVHPLSDYHADWFYKLARHQLKNKE